MRPNDRWTLFGRAERTDNNELLTPPSEVHGPTFTVGKVSFGVIRDFRVMAHLKLGIGALVSRSLTPDGLDTGLWWRPHQRTSASSG